MSALDPAVGSESKGKRHSKANLKQLGRPSIVNGEGAKGRKQRPARGDPTAAVKTTNATATAAVTGTATSDNAGVGVSGLDHRRYVRAVDGALPDHMLSLMAVSLRMW